MPPTPILCELLSGFTLYILNRYLISIPIRQIWSSSHVFYQGVLSASSEKGLYFLSSDIHVLLDHILNRYPSLDRQLLSPGTDKLVPTSAFSSPPIPVSFQTTEALQASRQGLKSTHNTLLLEQNRRVYDLCRAKGYGAFLAIDIESWERDHSLILELGWSYIAWSKGDDGRVDETKQAEHLSENAKTSIKYCLV